MGYVIIDLEFNNLNNITKYHPKFYEVYPDFKTPSIQNEIIQIGAIKVDKYMKVEGRLKEYIKPSVIPVLNPEITKITNITEEDLENGITFHEAINKLKDFMGDDVFCSWAKDDVAQIIINAHHHGYKNLEWIDKYLDVQEYASKILGVKKSLSLKNALKRLNIKVDNNLLHDALNDAEFTFLVFKQLYNYRIVKNYIVDDIYDIPTINIKDIENITLDMSKVKSVCPRCNKKLELDFDYMPYKWRFISIGKCSKCDASVLNEVMVKKTLHEEIIYYEIGNIIGNLEYLDYTYKLDKYFLKNQKVL